MGTRITQNTPILTIEQSQKLTEQRLADPEWKGASRQAEKICLELINKDQDGWNSIEWDEYRVNPERGAVYWRINLWLERRIAFGGDVFKKDYREKNVYLTEEMANEGIEYIRKHAFPEITRQKCGANEQLDLFKDIPQMKVL